MSKASTDRPLSPADAAPILRFAVGQDALEAKYHLFGAGARCVHCGRSFDESTETATTYLNPGGLLGLWDDFVVQSGHLNIIFRRNHFRDARVQEKWRRFHKKHAAVALIHTGCR